MRAKSCHQRCSTLQHFLVRPTLNLIPDRSHQKQSNICDKSQHFSWLFSWSQASCKYIVVVAAAVSRIIPLVASSLASTATTCLITQHICDSSPFVHALHCKRRPTDSTFCIITVQKCTHREAASLRAAEVGFVLHDEQLTSPPTDGYRVRGKGRKLVRIL